MVCMHTTTNLKLICLSYTVRRPTILLKAESEVFTEVYSQLYKPLSFKSFTAILLQHC